MYNSIWITLNSLAIILLGLTILRMQKRINLLESSDVYHHTKTTNVNVCDKIKQHNKKQYQVWKEK